MGKRLDDMLGEGTVQARPAVDGKTPRRFPIRSHHRQHGRETAEDVVEREVAAWYEEEHGDRKYVAFALDLMESTLGMDVSDAARLVERGLPAYIESKKPEIRRSVMDKAKSGENSPQGVVKALPLLNAVQSIVARKMTPKNGIKVVDREAGYDPARDGNGYTG